MIRITLGVIIGYAIFVISSIALIVVSGRNLHAVQPAVFMILTAAYGVFFSALSGWAAQKIAASGTLTVNYALAILMAGFAAFSLFKSSGSHWSQLQAIVVFAPVSLLGGILGKRKSGRKI